MPSTVALPVLLAISFCHLLNDMMQSLLPAIYPILKDSLHLDFGQVGLITLVLSLGPERYPVPDVVGRQSVRRCRRAGEHRQRTHGAEHCDQHRQAKADFRI